MKQVFFTSGHGHESLRAVKAQTSLCKCVVSAYTTRTHKGGKYMKAKATNKASKAARCLTNLSRMEFPIITN